VKKTTPKIFFVLFLCLSTYLSLFSQEFRIDNVPNPQELNNGYVSDPTNVFSASEATQINDIIVAIEAANTMEIAVVMLPSIGNNNPKRFSTDLFNEWGVGKSNNNGLMILTVLDQRRTEFETGYGTEAILPDVVCNQILRERIVPNFKQGKFGKGIIASLQEVKQIVLTPESTNYIKPPNTGSNTQIERRPEDVQRRPEYVQRYLDNKNRGWGFRDIPPFLIIYLLLNGLFHIVYFNLMKQAKSDKHDFYDRYVAIKKNHFQLPNVLFPIPYYFIYKRTKKHLKYLREAPRYSKINGMLLRRLSSESEKPYLDKGQVTEEEIGSVDYDVWITEDESDMLILRYDTGFSKYSPCEQCKYRTYYEAHSKVIKSANYDRSGLREEYYECKNCNFQETKTVVIPRKTRSTSSSGGSSGGGSSGGGSFGGGSSGGGGAGASW